MYFFVDTSVIEGKSYWSDGKNRNKMEKILVYLELGIAHCTAHYNQQAQTSARVQYYIIHKLVQNSVAEL